MFSANHKISIRQLQAILILTLFSSTTLTLPRITSEMGKQNGWILIITSSIMIIGYSIIIITLNKLFPNETLVEYSQKIISKPLGYLISILFVVNFIIYLSFEIRILGELTKQTLLINTPIEVIIMSTLFTATYLSRKGLECKSRLDEIILFVAFAIVILIILFSLEKVKLENFTPLFTIKGKDLFRGTFLISLTALGLETMYMSLAFVNNKKKLYKPVIQAIIFVMVANLLINYVTVGIFGAKTAEKQIWPFLSIMLAIDLPGSFIERQDAIMISFWILTEFALITSYLYFSSFAISRIVKVKKSNWINLVIIPIVYVIALVPKNVPETFSLFRKYVYGYGIIFIFAVPLVLLIIAKLRKLGEKNEI